MDRWGIGILVVFVAAYFITRQKYPVLAFLAGVGAGIVIGGIWAYYIVMTTPFP